MMSAPTTMHQCCLPGPYLHQNEPARQRAREFGEHARVCQSTAGKKEGGSPVRGTQESDRIASSPSAEITVCAGAVLSGGRGPEHQATGEVPQSADNTHCGSRLLAEVRRETRPPRSHRRKDTPITDFFNSHGILHSKPLTLPSTRVALPRPVRRSSNPACSASVGNGESVRPLR